MDVARDGERGSSLNTFKVKKKAAVSIATPPAHGPQSP